MGTKQSRRLGIVVFFAVLILLLGICAQCARSAPVPTPTVTPFSITDEEINKLSWDDVLKTVQHQQRIFKQEHATVLQLQQHLDDASTAAINAANVATGGLVHVDTLEQGIQVLADHDAKETARANKLDKALWWYRLRWWGAWVMLGLGVAMCVLFAILKATGKISFNAAKVAAKLPI